MSQLREGALRRYDETPDVRFYSTPRLVPHIDDRAIAAVTQLYREHFPPGGRILDLMSSWVSHLPPEMTYGRMVGSGMNEVELKQNPKLDEYVIQDLNVNLKLPFSDGKFDGVGCCVSIDYQGGRHLVPTRRPGPRTPRPRVPARGRQLRERAQSRPQPAPPVQ